MKYSALMFCMCLAVSVESAAEEKAITIPAPNTEIMKWSGVIYCAAILGTESPRVSRRLQPLRRWSHEQIKPIFPGSP